MDAGTSVRRATGRRNPSDLTEVMGIEKGRGPTKRNRGLLLSPRYMEGAARLSASALESFLPVDARARTVKGSRLRVKPRE